MERKHPEYTYEISLSIREIAQELRIRNGGNRKAYLRFRSRYYTLAYRPLIQGAERELGKAAMLAVQQLGGRLIRFATGRDFIEVDMLLPAEVPVHKANILIRRTTSRNFKECGRRGAGSPDANGYLWQPRTWSETLPPLLEESKRWDYETI